MRESEYLGAEDIDDGVEPMYLETRETEAEQMAENGAKRIEEAALRHLNGG